MKTMTNEEFSLIPIEKINFKIVYAETHDEGVEEFELHAHDEMEFYIGVAGDISFLVNNSIYPVSFGDVIISRPGEQHHCICHSEKDRKYFCIWFSLENNEFLSSVFENQINEVLISPDEGQKEQLIKKCYELLNKEVSSEEKFFDFLQILSILKTANGNPHNLLNMPDDLVYMLQYIDNHISENIKITDMAEELFISESTIERRFKEWLGTKPGEFIKKKKIVNAAQVLKKGGTVLDAGMAVGYSDNSHFIKLFKAHYGMTPHKYKKKYYK